MKSIFAFLFLLLCTSCTKKNISINEVSIVVLGTVQDAGSPQITCKKECCKDLFSSPDISRKVTSLGLIDPKSNKKFLFEATPNIATQIRLLDEFGNFEKETPDGVFLTHAHIGHYAGLMFFGKEAMNASKITTYTMPKMKNFLQENGPWSQLVTNNNIEIKAIENEKEFALTDHIKITPFTVPHRDEFSETVGYKIVGPNKSALFIPDIDKWEKWEKDIIQEIRNVDYAFLDATFYDGKEINNRDISEIPHPFVSESMAKFGQLEKSEKEKIIFIHFNHTNPLLNSSSKAYKTVINNGFKVANIKDVFTL
ncbi:Pyrroloquinoline quinone biosynthesis protein B [Tenacibaculum sp. 190130A14a]|uniref:Pyrroloquinoline quinone biosynthesis protein B n=1 Tax=Tenacibaculum polynesiense TaxID=3137857 RepID=A0ABM9PCN6_9FLAO